MESYFLPLQYEFQSDRDFEKMLKSDKKQLEEEKKKKEEKRANRMAIVGKKGNWQDDKVDSGEEVRILLETNFTSILKI